MSIDNSLVRRVLTALFVLSAGACGGGPGFTPLPDGGFAVVLDAGPACESCLTLGATCGTALDGCGGTVTCGSCPTNQSCGAGGYANRCGIGTCTPVTCASLSRNCGLISDGCGKTLDCGMCGVGMDCGAGGTTNVCGPSRCVPSCPLGTTCDSQLRCVTPASAANVQVVFDLKTYPISGEVKLNGLVPTAGGCPGSKGLLKFVEPTRGDVFEFEVTCPSANGPYLFEGALPPGTWEARLIGLSPFPKTETFITAGIVVPAAAPLQLDVRATTLTGTLTHNGARPVPACSTLKVLLRDVAHDITHELPVTCGWTAPYTFTATVAPGSWDVLIKSYNPAWVDPIPNGVHRLGAITVGAAAQTTSIDVVTRKVSGSVSHNGGFPACTTGKIRFVNTVSREEFTTSQDCNHHWSMNLYEGTWEMWVEGYTGSKIEGVKIRRTTDVTVVGDTVVPFNITTVPVTGTLTQNGQTPAFACDAGELGYQLIFSGARGATVTYDGKCGPSQTSFAIGVPPGTWELAVFPRVKGTIPRAYVGAGSVTVNAATVLAVDAKTIRAHGTLTFGGGSPYCGNAASVIFRDVNGPIPFEGPVSCDSKSEFWLDLPPGQFSVLGSTHDVAATLLSPSVTLAADRLDFAFDLRWTNLRLELLDGGKKANPCASGNYVHAREIGGSNVQETLLTCNWGNLRLPPGLYELTVSNDRYNEPAERMPHGARRVRLESRLWVP